MLPASQPYQRDRSQRRISRVLLWLTFAGASLATVIALFSRWSWFAELFSHYRLYYVLAQALLVIVFLNTRRWGWLALTLALAVPNLNYVAPYVVPLFATNTAQAANDAEPQLIGINLGYRNNRYAQLITYLDARRADVVVFSEYTPAWATVLEAALDEYPYREARPREHPFGLAVYSREPLNNVQWLDLDAPGSENLRAQVTLGHQLVDLFAVHLYPPTNPRRAAQRLRQLDALGHAVKGASGTRIVIGDLNLTPFSPLFKELLVSAGLVDARRPQGLHVTWPASPVPLWIPIDHCLTAPDGPVERVVAGPPVGSDHYPLEVTLTETLLAPRSARETLAGVPRHEF